MAKKCFLWIEAVIYISFFYLDIKGGDPFHMFGGLSSLLKYGGVWLCFFWSCQYRQWITIGLLGTVCADFFLLFTDWWLCGVLCFIGVQICYGIWLKKESFPKENFSKENFWRRVFFKEMWAVGAAIFLLATLTFFDVSVDALLVATAVYAMLLVQNTIGGIRSGRRKFAIGMCLFLLCDLQVGIYNMALYLPQMKEAPLFSWLEQAASVGIWVCYLPAKVLIALSGEK